MIIQVYTDGSCRNRTKDKGGYGVVIISGSDIYSISGGSYNNTTSQRMEMMAAICALDKILQMRQSAVINSDSQYIVNSVNKGWLFTWAAERFYNRANGDLWEKFLNLYQQIARNGYKVQLQWVKGHNGNHYNELADQLAAQGANSSKIIEDVS